MNRFEVAHPSTVAEASELLQSEDAKALAGGQTLIPTMKQRLAAPSRLVRLAGIAEMRGLRHEDNRLIIGASTTHATVARVCAAYPALAALAGGIGDPAVRNRGTIGGSLANNDPSACYPSAVLASDATIITDRRKIQSDAFFQGVFTTALEHSEIITAVDFPIPDRAAYIKFEQPASRFALVGVFVAKSGASVRVAITGAGEDGVFRWAHAEAALEKDYSPASLDALDPPDEAMMADLFGTKEYRAHIAKVLTKRAVASSQHTPGSRFDETIEAGGE
ncbi:FAD binding domain-containing protein [Agrobacterium tumefaciens]|uniref:Carbon-monoxide dehydrogenase medium subunit n=1 Tax=Agrobacterium tumefaciens TaxID=358 RepID=A0A2L2LMF6_AGRTU|nr:FAD binding domain-containing protein [Agrobacterium tumefaciens]AVH45408.1 carbon-monoxide dehydrogenase medium subunit [Agrobacterium tumefaciens]NSY99137.1 carbon monoxide dehydrogenase [Agrobacterium tumefaciens]